MVRHIVMWKFREDVSEEQRAKLREELPGDFAGLVGRIPKLISAVLEADPLGSSSHDMALITEHEDVEGKDLYAEHPAHLAVAGPKVRPYTTERAAFDYIVK